HRLHASSDRCSEAWLWFLLRSGNRTFSDEIQFALEKHPASHELRFALGIFQADNGEYENAITTFRELEDRDAASLHHLGVVLGLCGNTKGALSCVDLALRSRPHYHDAQYNVAAIRDGRPLRLTRRPFRPQVIAMIGV